MYEQSTLYNAILRIARNFLETRENIKILTHPFYHINLGWFSWEWSKFFFFFRKKNSKWPTQKKCIFQNRQFSKFWHKGKNSLKTSPFFSKDFVLVGTQRPPEFLDVKSQCYLQKSPLFNPWHLVLAVFWLENTLTLKNNKNSY